MRARQWRPGGADDEEESYSEDVSNQGSSRQSAGAGGTSSVDQSSGQERMSSVGPPPTYDGDRKPGSWEDYRLRARLWLKTTTIAPASRGPRMLQQLTGKAFDTMKHLAEDDSWMDDRENGSKLLEEMGRADRFGREELESLWSALHRLLYSKLKQSDDDVVTFRTRFEETTRKVQRHNVKLPAEALGFTV